ncbi:PREDICTED: uncharacterized protein LOC105364730 [Ceratosolen solmsi marchali]|uniref:Uncharacterized protein LOC105364730 n=1 Tax=Ceratosolen solmsi marchali TaxID=326594 RepID=A0AAJ7DYH1_9HYME|nr:PREDICTED: uncharacterized protein LOC105364730 [Ceratosolen solmsi marchali]
MKSQPHKLNLKGRLVTPQDWARFDTWAKENAKPKKLIVQKDVFRKSKPLFCLIPRLTILAEPKRDFNEFPCITRLLCSRTLKFKATRRLKRLARPRCPKFGNNCKKWGVRCPALFYNATDLIIKLSQPKKRNEPDDCKLANATPRGWICVPNDRTNMLAQPKGLINETFLSKDMICYAAKPTKISPWVDFLALPSYKMLKDNESENAIKMKQRIVEELKVRGKQALSKQRQKEGVDYEYLSRTSEKEEDAEENKKMKDHQTDKDSWRFVNTKCKEFPPKISKSALNHEASELTTKLAQPRIRKMKTCRKDPLKVKESAKNAQSTPRLDNLAKPKYVSQPVVKDKPRERDEYDRPIFVIPLYQRVLPKAKPYKLAECKQDNEDETDERRENRENEERERKEEKRLCKEINKIICAPTIDPLYDPVGAERQMKERKRAFKKQRRIVFLNSNENL